MDKDLRGVFLFCLQDVRDTKPKGTEYLGRELEKCAAILNKTTSFPNIKQFSVRIEPTKVYVISTKDVFTIFRHRY